MNDGWISLHRRMLDWEWYLNTNVKVLFIHLLLKANHQDNRWQGIEIKRGQTITSHERLSHETTLSIMQIRSAIKKLISTGEITHQPTSNYSLITINNYNSYQEDNKRNNKRITSEQQTNNKRITTNNNDNNESNDNKYIRELEEYLETFNAAHQTKYTSYKSIVGNYREWRSEYTQEKILEAVRISGSGKWWATNPKPELLLRRKNPQGEQVDYIGELLNLRDNRASKKGGVVSVS